MPRRAQGVLALGLLLALPHPGSAQARPVVARTATPLYRLIRAAVEERFPSLLTEGVTGASATLYLVADGRGVLTHVALDGGRPAGRTDLESLALKFPDLHVESWEGERPLHLPLSTLGRYLPGELGPDTVFVIAAEPPMDVDMTPPPAIGPYLFMRTTARTMHPVPVREAAARAGAGEVLWYAVDAERRLLEMGSYAGRPDLARVREIVQGRHPELEVTCSGTASYPTDDGRLVPVIEATAVPRSGG